MFELRNRDAWRQFAPLALRLVIGFGFIAHGWAKLDRGPDKFAHVLAWMDVPLASLPLIAIHLVAMFGVHWQYGFSSVNTVGLTAAGPQFGPPGFEVNLLYIAGLLAIVLGGGAGAWSVDRLLGRRNNRP